MDIGQRAIKTEEGERGGGGGERRERKRLLANCANLKNPVSLLPPPDRARVQAAENAG